ncbi:TetR family transcriptional regulator [Streptomyces sp. NBC_01304]|uniref:TetR family transcriptional regulator n=1 Tax=Streptomyces sp. NBC_01304 TaxID=2903818 RepID=UPI002E142E3C|nr:TetR family transcriptional regulator [Streptomyces sp. NBC_01304]
MTKQERAGRTRRLLIDSAAVEFARRGYVGTSLNKICTAAMATVGALTFHFPAKSTLAEAVCAQGAELTRKAVAEASGAADSPLRGVVDVTQALAGLLDTEPAVQAAARLTREQRDIRADWYDAWFPTVRDLLDRAHQMGQLRGDGAPQAVMALVGCLVAGFEGAAMRVDYVPPGGGSWSPKGQLDAMWDVILPGVVTPPGTSL